MTGTIVVAVIAATPPTLAAMLAFFSSRASYRVATAERAALVAKSLDSLSSAVGQVDTKVDQIETKVDRVESVVVELRERVARLEGARPIPHG